MAKTGITQAIALLLTTLSGTATSILTAPVTLAAMGPTPESLNPPPAISDTANRLPLVFDASTGGFDDQGRPQSRSSGGSRGDCRSLLIALVPGEGTLANENGCDQPSLAFTAATITPAPTLWFYIPAPSPNQQVELALLDDNQQAIVIETPSVPSTAGIVGIPLSYELQPNQSYRWVLSMMQNTSPPRMLTVEGTVRRVALNEEQSQQLAATSDPRSRILFLAQAGIWHDALTELVALRQQQPEDTTITEDWQQFLGSVGLAAIADAPIVD